MYCVQCIVYSVLCTVGWINLVLELINTYKVLVYAFNFNFFYDKHFQGANLHVLNET